MPGRSSFVVGYCFAWYFSAGLEARLYVSQDGRRYTDSRL
jgi:hypothetical protein